MSVSSRLNWADYLRAQAAAHDAGPDATRSDGDESFDPFDPLLAAVH